jgi:hypothetical protein
MDYKRHPTGNPRVIWPVVCETCGRIVMIWFGVGRCGCTPEHSHLVELERQVRERQQG